MLHCNVAHCTHQQQSTASSSSDSAESAALQQLQGETAAREALLSQQIAALQAAAAATAQEQSVAHAVEAGLRHQVTSLQSLLIQVLVLVSYLLCSCDTACCNELLL
jgi:hypothetical protein